MFIVYVYWECNGKRDQFPLMFLNQFPETKYSYKVQNISHFIIDSLKKIFFFRFPLQIIKLYKCTHSFGNSL